MFSDRSLIPLHFLEFVLVLNYYWQIYCAGDTSNLQLASQATLEGGDHQHLTSVGPMTLVKSVVIRAIPRDLLFSSLYFS